MLKYLTKMDFIANIETSAGFAIFAPSELTHEAMGCPQDAISVQQVQLSFKIHIQLCLYFSLNRALNGCFQ